MRCPCPVHRFDGACGVRTPHWSGAARFVVLAALALPAPGIAQQGSGPVDVWSTVNIVGQATGEDETRSELAASLDLFADARLGPLVLHAYVEGNTSPRRDGVSTRIPFANMDAGTALGADGRGRIQISELRLAWSITERTVWHAGLMDLTGFLDVSRISNDENLFFLAQPFVNNPTIIFPDYALATTLVLGVPALPRGRIAVALASSHGLADNPSASHEDLFDLAAEGKGAFAAGRMRWEGDRWDGSLGMWLSTGDRSASAPPQQPLPTRGVYSVVGWTSGTHSLDGRVGLATGDAGDEPFFGLTYLGSLGANVFGIGAARTPALPSFVDRNATHAEAFVRGRVAEVIYLTTSLQWLSAALLPEEVGEGTWIFGFRASATL